MDDRLYFAGEACPVESAGDDHCDYFDGLAAAEAMLAAGSEPRGA